MTSRDYNLIMAGMSIGGLLVVGLLWALHLFGV